MFYVVDASNRVVEVDGDWDDTLSRNGGAAHALRSRVLGRPLESFLAGDATRMFVRASLDAVRLLGETRVLPYRCDSPTERQQFEMVISLQDSGHVKVAHRLLNREPRVRRQRPPVGSLVAAWRCSQCLSVRAAGTPDWIGADVAAPDGPLAQDVCPACASRLFA